METLDDLAVFEEQESWNGVDPVLGSQFRVLVDIDLANFDLSLVLQCQFVDQRSDLSAGSAPSGPKVDEYRFARGQNITIKTGIGEFRCVSHLAISPWK